MQNILTGNEKTHAGISGDTLPRLSYLRRNARWWMTLVLIAVDAVSLSMSGFIAIGLRVLLKEQWRPELFGQLVPLIALCLGIYALRGLYPSIGVSPVEELRKTATTTSIVVLSMTALTFWARNAGSFSRLTFGLTWLFALALVPVGRGLIRFIGTRLDVWGEPVAIVGYKQQGKWISDFLLHNPNFGLKPVIVLDGFDEPRLSGPLPVLHMGNDIELRDLPVLTGIKTCLLIVSEVPEKLLTSISGNYKNGFQRIIQIPNLHHISSLGVTPCDLGGVLGLEVRHNLRNATERAVKRFMDIVLAVFGGLAFSPLLLLIAFLVRLDSRGKLFYGHLRVGKGGIEFLAWKFRTMVSNADQVLEKYLEENPDLRTEWETNHKLKRDPRVTRIGRFLRKFSLDELPQLWNVLSGEMSLVGPRPIVEDEIKFYGDRFGPYTWVLPGITGMWQVSGRTDTSYEERVRLDEYYVRNWSIWLDIYILARTFWVVIRREGAY